MLLLESSFFSFPAALHESLLVLLQGLSDLLMAPAHLSLGISVSIVRIQARSGQVFMLIVLVTHQLPKWRMNSSSRDSPLPSRSVLLATCPEKTCQTAP